MSLRPVNPRQVSGLVPMMRDEPLSWLPASAEKVGGARLRESRFALLDSFAAFLYESGRNRTGCLCVGAASPAHHRLNV